MTPDPAAERARRQRRKQDLLLASALARGQAVVAIDQIGQRADGLILGYRQLRSWIALPQAGAVGGVLASVAAMVALRRLRVFRLLRWGLLGWRVSRLAVNLLRGTPAPR